MDKLLFKSRYRRLQLEERDLRGRGALGKCARETLDEKEEHRGSASKHQGSMSRLLF